MQLLRVFPETFAVVLFCRLWPVLVSLFREQAVVVICHWQFAFMLRFQRIEHELHGLFSRKGRKRFARVFKHICKRRLLIRNDFARERNLLHDPFHFGDKRILYVCDGNLIRNSTHLIISPPDRNVFSKHYFALCIDNGINGSAFVAIESSSYFSEKIDDMFMCQRNL